MTVPPSTVNSEPVQKVDSSLARKTTTPATSSTVPARPRGIGIRSGGIWSVAGVEIRPGWTEFARMPWGASSIATDLVSPVRPHFEATYPCAQGVPRRPSMEEVLMIEPPPEAIIASAAARQPRKAPVRLTSSICCHSSRL